MPKPVLTGLQRLVLSIVCHSNRGHASIDGISFEAGVTPQVAGRVVTALSLKNLVSRQRFASGAYEIWPTDKGRELHKSLPE